MIETLNKKRISRSSLEAPNMVVMLVVMMMMMVSIFLVDQSLNVSKLLNMTRDVNGSFMIKSVLFLCLFQQLHKEGVINVNHRNYKLLLLLPLTHHDRQAPLWYLFLHFFLPLWIVVMVVVVMVMQMDMKIQQIFVISTTHLSDEEYARDKQTI